MMGQWPGVDNTWAQLVDGRVANDVGSTVQIRIQLWHATASMLADDGLQPASKKHSYNKHTSSVEKYLTRKPAVPDTACSAWHGL